MCTHVYMSAHICTYIHIVCIRLSVGEMTMLNVRQWESAEDETFLTRYMEAADGSDGAVLG